MSKLTKDSQYSTTYDKKNQRKNLVLPLYLSKENEAWLYEQVKNQANQKEFLMEAIEERLASLGIVK